MTHASSILQQAIQYGLKSPLVHKAGYALGQKAYNYLTTPSKFTKSTVSTPMRTRFVSVGRPTRFTRPSTVKRITRRTRRVNQKKRKINKLVGPAPKTYNVKSKTMRRNNKGKLSLQDRLQSGKSLPNTTFARLFWRGSEAVNLGASGSTVVSRFASLNSLNYTINDLGSSPSWSTNTNMQHGVTYAPLWQSLYNEYMVYGAKINIKLSPMYTPTYMSNLSHLTSGVSNSVPADAQPGYWYARAYYQRNPSNIPEAVGHPILRSPTLDVQKEDYWPSLREFLSDPTVTYVRDTTNIKTKIHLHSSSAKLDYASTTAVNLVPTTNTSYEIETTNRPINLTVNYSAKKHHSVKNPAQDLKWSSFGSSMPEDYQFNVRFGYIGFDSTGKFAYHSPVDRRYLRFCEAEVQYFVSFRGPRVSPHDIAIPSAAFMNAAPSPIDYSLDLDSLEVLENENFNNFVPENQCL